MGGSASVVQYGGRRRGNKAEENNLLRLYNGSCRDDRRLSEHHLLTSCVEESKTNPSPTIPGKDRKRHLPAHAKKISALPLDSGAKARCLPTTANTVGGDKKRRHKVDELELDSRRAERARARDVAVVQMYNSCHADLDQALANLKDSLHRCSIDGTGWATVTAVSAVLEQAGAHTDDSTVLLLANQSDDPHSPVRPMQEHFQDNAAAAVTKTRLVHWPTIIDFLEEGPSAAVTPGATSTGCKEGLLVSSTTPSTSTQSARTCQFDGKPAMLINADKVVVPLGTGDVRDDCNDGNPEVTPESKIDERGGESESECGDGRSSIDDLSCSGITRLKEGLREIEAGLRDMEVDRARPSPASRGDIMESIRELLKAKAGVLFDRGTTGPAGGRNGSNDEGREREVPSGAPRDGGTAQDKTGNGQDSQERLRLTTAACAAGKSGDVSTLEDLADSVDLRTRDAFGRNPLYYTCLCGHVCAAHFVVVRAYGGVEGIPEKERWECRTNALSEEMRRYLDTGTLPNETPNRTPKSDEGRQAALLDREKNRRRGKANNISSIGRKELVETRDSGMNSGSSVSAAHIAVSPPDATISIASLFGWGYDRETDGDY